MRNSQSFFSPPNLYQELHGPEQHEKLKIVTCIAHSLFFLWAWHQLLLCHFGPSSESRGTGKNQPSRLGWGARTPLGVQGQAQESRSTASGTLSSLFFFIKTCPCASAGLPLLRHTGTLLWTEFSKKPKMLHWLQQSL